MSVPPVGFANATVFFAGPGANVDDAELTFGVHPPAITVANAEAIFDAFTDNFKSLVTGHYDLSRLELRDHDGNVFTSTNTPVTGTASGAPVPPQVAMVFNKLSGLGGRRNRGRFFLPGMAASGLDPDGSLTTGQFATAVDAGVNFIGDLGALDVTMVILHTDLGIPTDVTALTPAVFSGTQRRRLH